MRNIVLVSIILITLNLHAQVKDSIPKSYSPVSGVLNLPKQFFFIDITQNSWLDAPAGVTTKWISGGVNVNFLYEINLIGSLFSIAPGLSYSVHGVKSNSFFDYHLDSNKITYTDIVPVPDSILKKSKLSTSYLEVPLEIHIHTRPAGEKRKSFLIAPGFRIGLLVDDFWKVKSGTQPLAPSKVKIYDIENISKLHYGISLRLMYYKFGLYGYYSLSKLFGKDKGPAITQYSVGISLSPL